MRMINALKVTRMDYQNTRQTNMMLMVGGLVLVGMLICMSLAFQFMTLWVTMMSGNVTCRLWNEDSHTPNPL